MVAWIIVGVLVALIVGFVGGYLFAKGKFQKVLG
jgi:uncharacterized protein YneF (UPF0154 family)